MKFNAVDWIAMILLVIGGLNWGLVGFFNYDLVAGIFGGGDPEFWLARTIYAIVGIAALYAIFWTLPKMSKK